MKNKFLRWASSAAMGFAAFTIIGTYCRTWFYQPPIAASILTDDE